MARLTNDEIAQICWYEIQQAQGYDSDVLSNKRAKALDYYYGKMTAPAEGRSSIVSTDLADAVHNVLAQIQPILKSTLIEFTPNGEQDEPQAQAESDFTRDAIERAHGWRAIFESVHDALLIGNGWVKITAKTEDTVTEEEHPPGLPDEMIYFLSQPTAEQQTVDIRAGKTRTRVIRTTTETRLEFEAVPPEDMLFSEGHGQEDINKQRFVGQRKLYTVSQLRELGIRDDVIRELEDVDSEYWTAVEARQGLYQNDDGIAAQDAERLKLVYCCYIMIALDDKTSERRYIWLGGNNHILKNEPADHVPYVTGSAIPTPHRVQGTGLFEVLAEIQEGKTAILRNYMDNLEVMNASRVGAVEGQVNMTDLTSGRVNGVVRIRNPNALVPLPSNDIGAVAMQGLDYLDRVRVQRIGASLDMHETQAQLMSSSATAAAGTLGEVEKMAGWYATNLVETMLKPAFSAVHRLMRTEMPGPKQAKIRGKWQQSDSGQWPERKNMDCVMGMTTAEKSQRVMSLGQVLQHQMQLMMTGAGGMLVDPGNIYNAMTDWVRASNLDTPEQYMVDPQSPEAQAAAQQQQQQQQQMQEQMQQLQQQMVAQQQQFELEKQRRDLEYKRWSDLLDAEVEEAKITETGITEMAKLRQQANGSDSDTGTDRGSAN
jgi:hypothetical protein